MAVYNIYFKLVVELAVKNSVTESQIRNFLVDAKPQLVARVTALVGNAPPVASATLGDIDLSLRVDKIGPGLWSIYPKMLLTITVADGITELQVRNYFEGYWDQAKTDVRTLIGNAPPGANAQIVGWHAHRLSGDGDEVES